MEKKILIEHLILYGNSLFKNKIPLVAMLSDTSNNFANELYDSINQLIQFVELDYFTYNVAQNSKSQ